MNIIFIILTLGMFTKAWIIATGLLLHQTDEKWEEAIAYSYML